MSGSENEKTIQNQNERDEKLCSIAETDKVGAQVPGKLDGKTVKILKSSKSESKSPEELSQASLNPGEDGGTSNGKKTPPQVQGQGQFTQGGTVSSISSGREDQQFGRKQRASDRDRAARGSVSRFQALNARFRKQQSDSSASRGETEEGDNSRVRVRVAEEGVPFLSRITEESSHCLDGGEETGEPDVAPLSQKPRDRAIRAAKRTAHLAFRGTKRTVEFVFQLAFLVLIGGPAT